MFLRKVFLLELAICPALIFCNYNEMLNAMFNNKHEDVSR